MGKYEDAKTTSHSAVFFNIGLLMILFAGLTISKL